MPIFYGSSDKRWRHGEGVLVLAPPAGAFPEPSAAPGSGAGDGSLGLNVSHRSTLIKHI